jgi:hypothetical protein
MAGLAMRATARRKAHDYNCSLGRSFIETKTLFEAGTFPEWTFSEWLLAKAGLSEQQIIKMIRAMQSEETPPPTQILTQDDWRRSGLDPWASS